MNKLKQRGDPMELMKPIRSEDLTMHDDFVYEVKYDGFRAVLVWTKDSIQLFSKNKNDLAEKFPEIINYCQRNQHLMKNDLPIVLDGELVILNNDIQGNFANLQRRNRLTNETTIQIEAYTRPATLMAFDITSRKSVDLKKVTYLQRKQILQTLLQKIDCTNNGRLRYVPYYEQMATIWELVFLHKGEGIVAKRKNGQYQKGEQHHDWFKVKNWCTIHGFLTAYNTNNDYFTVSVYDQKVVRPIGKCKHGLNQETKNTLKQVFLTEGKKQGSEYSLPPAICVQIHTLDLHGDELREPEFSQLLPKLTPDKCTYQNLRIDLAMLPPTVERTNVDKLFWEELSLTKADLLIYLRNMSLYMLPFLHDRALTVIRCPDGVSGKSFFQKSLSSYAPALFNTRQTKNKDAIICNHLDALIWLANHGAVEYHIPFQTITSSFPSEIVFDLDPPHQQAFQKAVFAAKLMKQIFDDLQLKSFIKTSGNKGLQIHIPLPEKSLTYRDTALFTKAIAEVLVNEFPHLFTIERLKKKRKDRLYIDYVQHGEGKTLIAPYSPRKTQQATVATPIYWEELQDDLTPDKFTMQNVLERVQTLGCPFQDYFSAGQEQRLAKLQQLIN